MQRKITPGHIVLTSHPSRFGPKPIPEDLIPPDARVEIEAKKAAGYYTPGEVLNQEGLAEVKGRGLD